jgi:multidrug efflux pump
MFPPPPVQGLGTIGGFKLQIQDRAALGNEALNEATQAFLAKARAAPELAGMFSSFQINVPQLYADLDRTRAQQLGVSVPAVFDTLQIYLGSLYVNDFNKFGRTFQVRVQADAPFRAHAEDIGLLKARNSSGEMVPLSSMLKMTQSYGPDQAVRYNAFPAADINGGPAPGYSTGQAQAVVERLLAETLPRGIGYEWTEITYQEKIAGNTLFIILPLSMLLVFFVLAAQYESLTLPLAVLLIVPMGILSAIFGVWLTGGDDNLFTQISLIVLVGLACKNAILIVEFAHELEQKGRTIYQAAIEAASMRLRPILMTSIAFIAGVVPLILSSGAGAEMRHAMGVAVFSGMIGVTSFGLFLTPVFYVLLRSLANFAGSRRTGSVVSAESEGAAAAAATPALPGATPVVPHEGV